MNVEQSVSQNGKEVTLCVKERFDFSLHQLFRESYIKCEEPNSVFNLDLSKTTYMDSSALGMILLLKEHADKLLGKVIIYKPNDSVSKILEIAQFHRLMDVVE